MIRARPCHEAEVPAGRFPGGRTDIRSARDGPFALYELRKQSLGTIEAVQAIAERWRISLARISFGGLKDKHAVTCQYLTVAGGPAGTCGRRTSN